MKASTAVPLPPDASYLDKEQDYFSHVRAEILPLLPAAADRVVEIGCGVGDTLAWLKAAGRCRWALGVELVREAAEKARRKSLDSVIEMNFEHADLAIEPGSIDMILCLDVLEHFVDPWSAVRRLHALLKPGGVLVASIPNVGHHSVVLPLLLHGRWDYRKEGILDQTHLRFFDRKGAVRLLECSGLRVDTVVGKGPPRGSRGHFVNALTLSLFARLFDYQYLLRARCPGST